MSSIPAQQIVSTNPSVLSAGGDAIDTIALMLTTSTRVPIGTVQPFADDNAVSNFFGPGVETNNAAIYFQGFDNSDKKPASLLMAQYNQTAVAAYLRGGNISGLTLSQLQAISGSLNIIVDGYPRNAASVNLSAASSFSAAAGTIQTALNAADPSEATVTAAIGATVTASIATTVLTVTVATGLISVGDSVTGAGVAAGTKILSLGSGTGGTGTYNINNSRTVSSESMTVSSNVLNVTAVGSGSVAPGQSITGAGVTETIITAQLGGATGGIGTYSIAGSPQQVASESMSAVGTPVAVTFDSVSGAFVIASGYTGAGSTVAFATGTAAAPLLLTSANGATLSQGAAAAVPATFMNAVVQTNSDFATFMTLFDPDGGNGFAVKEAFAAWKNTQNDRFGYICWDTDQSPVVQVPASASLGFALANNNDSGTCLLDGVTAAGWNSTSAANLASFVAGVCASINFEEANGRVDPTSKAQAGLVPTVTDGNSAINLGGNPQAANFDPGNGYNFYGAYAQANNNFIWFQRGQVTGDFRWLDSYINQIWLNAQLQNAALTFFKNTKSVQFSVGGASLIEQALTPVIDQGLSFGAYGPGDVDAAQAVEVNQQAGVDITNTLETQGFYLQVLQPPSAVRAARGPWSIKFWYLDRGSVQSLSINTVAVQ